jgi:hypothetical protein
MNKLYVIINCDTDPVYEPYSRLFSQKSVWEETIENILILKDQLNKFENEQSYPKVIWHLRSDCQIEEIWGSWCYPCEEYLHLWKDFESQGDEIGWHAHLWRLNERDNSWYQEINDRDWIAHCLLNGYHAISKYFKIRGARMGWSFHDNFTMNILKSIGIEYDLSAIPGLKNLNCVNNIYNWENADLIPYFPSNNNYMIGNIEKNSILEIPITTYDLPTYMKLFLRKRLMTANIAKSPFFFKHALKKIERSKKHCCSILNAFFHPSDLKSGNALFSSRYFEKNLMSIYNLKNFKILFVTPSEFFSKFRQSIIGKSKKV